MAESFKANVVAFEPDLECFKLVVKNLENKNLPITLYSEALGSKNGLKEFFIYSSGASSLYRHKTERINAIVNVQLRRFDSMKLTVPDLLAIDAQSSEFEIIKGFGMDLIKTKFIIFETGFYSIYNSHENFDLINKYLKDLGFTFIATNVSGKGRIRFYIMRIRGIIHNLRTQGFKGLKVYSGFFDVLYRNKHIE